MTTFASHDTSLDERVREAWTTYREELEGLTGAEYEAAEARCWEALQDTLNALDGGAHAGASAKPDSAG